MITELNSKSQNALFEFIVTKLGLSDGDLIDVSEQDGKLVITPANAKNDTDIDWGSIKGIDFSKTHTPDGKPKRTFATREEYSAFLDDICGSIDDPTMVEPEEVKYEPFREPII